MLEALLGPVRAELDRLGKEYTPDILVRAGFAKMADFVLYECLNAGPPEFFATELGLNETQAKRLYWQVLFAAITRNVGSVDYTRIKEGVVG